MRILIVDDDDHLISVLQSILTDRGHDVVGHAAMANDAYSLLARTKPDAAIVDLSLRVGSGRDFARDAAARGCRVVVFSAFVDDIDAHSLGVVGVSKPDFAALETAVDALAATRAQNDGWRSGHADRRALTPSAGRATPSSAIEEAADFYRALGEAHPGDSLLVIDAPSEDDATILAVSVRAFVRTNDHLMQRGTQLSVLLVDGLPNAADTVLERVRRAAPSAAFVERHAVLEDEIPGDVYQRLRSG